MRVREFRATSLRYEILSEMIRNSLHGMAKMEFQRFATHQSYIQVCVLDNTIILVCPALSCRISNAPFCFLDAVVVLFEKTDK